MGESQAKKKYIFLYGRISLYVLFQLHLQVILFICYGSINRMLFHLTILSVQRVKPTFDDSFSFKFCDLFGYQCIDVGI